MKRLALGVAVVLMAGTVTMADDPTLDRLAEAEAQAAARSKSAEKLKELLQEANVRRDNARVELQLAEESLSKLTEKWEMVKQREDQRPRFIRVGKVMYDPVTDTLKQDAAKQKQIEHRLTEVEQRLDLILNELKDLKGR